MTRYSLPNVAVSAARLFGMESADSDRHDTFARVIKERRKALGMSQRDVYDAGGPSPATQIRWEKGDLLDAPPRSAALRRMDKALRWRPGTTYRLFSGQVSGEEAKNSKPFCEGNEVATTVERALDANRLILDYSSRMMRYVLATLSFDNIAPDMAEEGRQLMKAASDHYATLLLEEHGGPGQILPNDISHIVLPVLSAPEPQRGTEEHIRWSYRRWLSGVTSPDEDAQAFQQYWQQRNWSASGTPSQSVAENHPAPEKSEDEEVTQWPYDPYVF